MECQNIALGTYRLKGVQCINQVKSGLEIGYRHIDTAELYKNHKEVSQGISLSGLDRYDLFITSKIFNNNITKLKISESVDKMLKELGTNYIDCVLLHNPVTNYELAWKELVKIKSHYNIRYIGTSNFSLEQLDKIITNTGINPYLNQIELSIVNQPTKELLDYHKSNNIIIQAHSIYTNNQLVSDDKIKSYSEELGISTHNLMLKYLTGLNIPIVTGTTSLAHLKDNFDWVNYPAICLNNDIVKSFNCDYCIYKKLK